jgi:dipeptide/tripeptide permease
LILSATGLAYVPFGETVPLLVVAAIAIGVAKGLLPLLTLVVVADYTTREERGLALSLRMMALRLQSVINPLVFGGITAGLGPGAAFGLAGVLMFSSAGWIHMAPVMREGLKRPTSVHA